MTDYVRHKIKNILIDHGIESLINDYDEEFFLDSIQYVSILVSIEQQLSIDIPDEYIIIKDSYSINDFVSLVDNVLDLGI